MKIINLKTVVSPRVSNRVTYNYDGKIFLKASNNFTNYCANTFPRQSLSVRDGYIYIFETFLIYTGTTEGSDLQKTIDELYEEYPYSFENFSMVYLNKEIFLKSFYAPMERELTNHRSKIVEYNRSLRDSWNIVREKSLIIEKIKDKVETLDFNKFNSKGLYVIKYENIVAEDVQCKGDPINLGTLTYGINFRNSQVTILDGTYKRNGYCDNVFVPHQMSNNTLCFGTLGPDVQQAIVEFELDILIILLRKFSSVYNSNDDAGKKWKRWEDAGRFYVPYLNKYIDEELCVRSEYQGCYLLKEDAVFNETFNSFIRLEDFLDLGERGLFSINGPDVVPIDGIYYHIDDVVINVHGVFMLKEHAIFLESKQAYYPLEDVIAYEDKYYLPHELPVEVATALELQVGPIILTNETAVVGLRVRRGPDWNYRNQDSEGTGTIIETYLDDKRVRVSWDESGIYTYPYGNTNVLYGIR